MNRPTQKERIDLYNTFHRLRVQSSHARFNLELNQNITPTICELINTIIADGQHLSTLATAIMQRGMDALAAAAPKTEVPQK